MRVAAIYDIHGNLPALEAVLREIREEGVDRIVVGGDVVPGPMPRQTIAMLLELPVPVQFITGNGERDIIAAQRGEALTRVPESFHEDMRWVANQLPSEVLAEMAEWPPTVTLAIEGLGDVLFCHATPRDDNELFTRITPEDRLEQVFETVDAELVVCGHTHMQFDRKIGAVRVINAGSVGMPFGKPGAYWLLLGAGIDLRRTRYDLAEATGRIRATEYPRAADFEVEHPPPEGQMIELFESATLQ